MRIVGCFIFYQDKFPILLRHTHKSNGGKWGLPAGKVEENETDVQAIIREVQEETGYQAKKDEVEHIDNHHFGDTISGYDFTSFYIHISQPFDVKLEDSAHSEVRWVTAAECYAIPNLVPDLHDLIKKLELI